MSLHGWGAFSICTLRFCVSHYVLCTFWKSLRPHIPVSYEHRVFFRVALQEMTKFLDQIHGKCSALSSLESLHLKSTTMCFLKRDVIWVMHFARSTHSTLKITQRKVPLSKSCHSHNENKHPRWSVFLRNDALHNFYAHAILSGSVGTNRCRGHGMCTCTN